MGTSNAIHSLHLKIKNAADTLLAFVKQEKKAGLFNIIKGLFEDRTPLQKAIGVLQSRALVKKAIEEDPQLASIIENAILEYNRVVKKRLRSIPPTIIPCLKFHQEGKEYPPIKGSLPRDDDLRLMRMVSLTQSTRTMLPKIEIQGNASERTFQPLPGEKISFSDTSYLLRSCQTGYPDPALLGGLVFPEVFSPVSSTAFLNRKSKLAEGLLPKGLFNSKAKKIYTMFLEIDFKTLIHLHEKVLNVLFKEMPLIRSIKSYDELSCSYREVNKTFESMYEYIELSNLEGSFSEENLSFLVEERKRLLPNDFSKDLFEKIWNHERGPFTVLTAFQQLYFDKLLHQKLNKEFLLSEIEKYFNALASLAAK